MDFTLDENTHAQVLKIRQFIKNELQPLEDDVEVKGILASNTANEIFDKEELKKLLVDQMENRVRWRESVIYMINNEVNQFIEIGPGKVLSGLVKRINKDVKINTINNENDIKDLEI